MKTITVSIGNSDNKLTQVQWAEFVDAVNTIVREHARQVHFFGGPPNYTPWQNVLWMLDFGGDDPRLFYQALTIVRMIYGQDSVAIIEGETKFI